MDEEDKHDDGDNMSWTAIQKFSLGAGAQMNNDAYGY